MMRILRGIVVASFLLAGNCALAAVESFDFVVPKRGNSAPGACPFGSTAAACRFEIAAAKITLLLDSTNDIVVTVTRAADGQAITTQTIKPADIAADCFPAGCGLSATQLFALEAGATLQDSLLVFKKGASELDPYPGDNKVMLLLYLGGNANDRAGCPTASPMSGDETWNVKVVTPGMPLGPKRIAGVAIQSLDTNVSRPCPASGYRAIPENEGPQITVNTAAPIFATGRVPLDTVLVLDRSGSMSATDGGTQTRLQALRLATESFLRMWSELRYRETIIAAPTISPTGDHVGIVFFDDTIQWASGTATVHMEDWPPPPLPAPPAIQAATQTLIDNVNAVPVRGSTSIGKGLIEAANALPAGANRRAILLMTDGQQNTTPFAYASGGQVFTSDSPGGVGAPTVLPNQPFKVYTVTLGNAFGADAPINQELANATGAYTLHAFTANADLLNIYFLQLLQNFHRFATVETLRIVQDKTRAVAPFEMTLPVTTTTKRLAFALTASGRVAGMRVELVPPGGGAPISFVPAAGAGAIVNGVNLPLSAGNSGAGLWKVRVVGGSSGGGDVPFSLTIMGDDAAINSSVVASAPDPIVGKAIKLTARVSDFGPALKGLGGQAGAVVKATMVVPGSNVGDVLSDSPVAPAATPAGDVATPAQNKMDALLAANPNAFVRNSGEIVLRDDGMNGDDTANDGIYTAVVPADFEGHYNFVFYVEGNAASGGRFVRQQIRTVHIRSMPVLGNSTLTTSVVNLADGNFMAAVVTPRNVRNGKLGPGWRNYVWFTVPGRAPIKPADNLNGTYTATIPFSGGTPPAVTVTFLPEPIPRADSFVPTDAQLASGVAIVTPGGGTSGGRAVWLAVGSTFPSGSFSNAYKRDLAVNLGLEFPMAPNIAIEATLGSHQFKGKNGAPDIDVTQFAANGKWYFPQPGFAPFVTLGAGAYSFDPGSSRFGLNAGAGVQVKLSPSWSLEGRYTFHGISGNSPNSRYSTLAVGFRYDF